MNSRERLNSIESGSKCQSKNSSIGRKTTNSVFATQSKNSYNLMRGVKTQNMG